MKKWQCLVCGWIYDEAEGWPDDGIEPGTKWEDIPDDWTCPDCGVGKEDFEMAVIKTAPTPQKLKSADADPIIIIGSGLAAQNLTKEIRKLNQSTSILMITMDDGNLYYKPNLSAALSGQKTPDELVLSRRPDIEQELSIKIKPYTKVSEINTKTKTVSAGDNVYSYSKLVLATGASVIKPPFKGDATDLILSVNNLDDYRRYRASLVGKSKVAIVGAGLIGCEFANDLLASGFEVELIDASDHLMQNLLPQEAANALEKSLLEQGAIFHFGRQVASVDKTSTGFKVQMNDKSEIEADLVISAVGLKANTSLADNAGIKTSLGIEVNQFLETSEKDVYAIGDCANIDGQHLMYIEPIILSVKALAKTLIGEETKVKLGTLPVTVKTPFCPIVVAPPANDLHGHWDVEGDGHNIKATFHDKTGKLCGFALTGNKVSFKSELMNKV